MPKTPGSSPQARGTQKPCNQKNGISTVHPRRRGEHPAAGARRKKYLGSSPQARGTQSRHSSDSMEIAVHPRRRGEHRHCVRVGAVDVGSSPQARGTPAADYQSTERARFIPAGAGNTLRHSSDSMEIAVHPRRRGEHRHCVRVGAVDVGSSPQARGTPAADYQSTERARFIPAGAGNTL